MSREECKQTVGKPRISLVPPALLEQVALVRAWAIATKYKDENNWRKVPPREYLEAILRHALACIRKGWAATDPESGLSHMAHIATNAAFILELVYTNENVESDYRDIKQEAWIDDTDYPLPEDAAIEATHPDNNSDYIYADMEALRFVGAKRSKRGLVGLVRWLLVERDAHKSID